MLLGILTRGSGSGGGKAGANGAPAGQNLGYIAILGAALGYACLGRALRLACTGSRVTSALVAMLTPALCM